MKTLKVDKTTSDGIAIGPAYIAKKPSVEPDVYAAGEKNAEIEKLHRALHEAAIQLEKLGETDTLFAAHLEILKDQGLLNGVLEKIEHNKRNVQQAVWEAATGFITMISTREDTYIRERAADIRDVRNRLMYLLKGVAGNPFEKISSPVILVAEELTPSDIVLIDLQYILGMITEAGGVTSHVSIMAKNIGLPILVGAKGIVAKVRGEDTIIMDAALGEIVIDPSEATIREYKERSEKLAKENEEIEAVAGLPACTKEGQTVRVLVNVGSVGEIKYAAYRNITGIGLFRSEDIYMEQSHFPTEEEQFGVYKEAALLCTEELTIRTLDIGGDKKLPYFKMDKEENPFLGWRAIRISLDLKDIFKVQLRAILRASAFGNVRIMFPMIVSMEELRAAKELLESCKKELTAEGLTYNQEIPIGMIMETPAAVIMADEFAREVDFFSIGTNDLIQYLLAVDRGNTKMASRYDAFHPAVLTSIRTVITAGHKAGIKVAMCGEMASDGKAIAMLLEMGLDEFSVSVSSYAKVKYAIRNTTVYLTNQ